MIRLPPRSTRTDTLFPYTTLFRSVASIWSWTAPSPAQPVAMSDSWVVDSCDGLHDIEAAMNDVKPHDRNVRCTHRLRPVPYVRPPAFRTRLDATTRSEERRVGNECVSTGGYRWWQNY